MMAAVTWDDLVPHEKQQGGWWDYTGAFVYGNGKTLVTVRSLRQVASGWR